MSPEKVRLHLYPIRQHDVVRIQIADVLSGCMRHSSVTRDAWIAAAVPLMNVFDVLAKGRHTLSG
jgi:hypothetical protein